MTRCVCAHAAHHHIGGGVCTTLTIAGPATPQAYWGAAADLHIGRSLTYCQCSDYRPDNGS